MVAPQKRCIPENGNVATTLAASSEELGNLAHLSKEIQWAISSLLETAHHPNLTVEMHVLQDIDRLQQTLMDLSGLMKVISNCKIGEDVDIEHLKQSIRLESLKTRLFHEDTTISPSGKEDEVTWL